MICCELDTAQHACCRWIGQLLMLRMSCFHLLQRSASLGRAVGWRTCLNCSDCTFLRAVRGRGQQRWSHAWTGAWACQQLSSLTLQYSPSGNDKVLHMEPLHGIPALRELELWHCCPSQPLQLSGLTAFTFITQQHVEDTRAAPVMRLCPRLRQLHVFVADHNYVLSWPSLPDFCALQPMHIKYILGPGGHLVLSQDLQGADGRLPVGLHLQLCEQNWPGRYNWGCDAA